MQKNYFMKKLLLFSVLLLFVGCEKVPELTPKQICEQKAIEWITSFYIDYDGNIHISEITFLEFQEVNLPIDSFINVQNYTSKNYKIEFTFIENYSYKMYFSLLYFNDIYKIIEGTAYLLED